MTTELGSRPGAPTVAGFVRRLAASPCCAALVGEEHLERALASRAPIIFVLRGNGQSVAGIHDAPSVSVIVDRLETEYNAARERLAADSNGWSRTRQ